MAVRAAGPTDGAEAAAIAAAVDASACGPARLRAAAAALAGRRVAVVGTLPDAERASACGLNVAACWAPPLGVVRLGRRAFLRAVGGPRPYGTIAAVGLRAREAARMARIRVAELPLSLPDPLRPLDRRSVREDWGVADGDIVCLALGAPPSAVDARRVLDIAGRAAYLGGP
ncbi:MAG: hypothetical protein EBU70_10035, partial [Actinobacteria bacterium]|nr:hypothetical protein [Actinomycetota bacterium]